MIDIKNNEINIKNRLLGGIHKRKPMAAAAAAAAQVKGLKLPNGEYFLTVTEPNGVETQSTTVNDDVLTIFVGADLTYTYTYNEDTEQYEDDTYYIKILSFDNKNLIYTIEIDGVSGTTNLKSNYNLNYYYTQKMIDTLKEDGLYEAAYKPNVNDVVPKETLDLLLADGITIDILLEQNWISIDKSEPESDIIIDLNEGWNLIGSSYNGTLEDPESIIIPHTLYAYDNSYVTPTEINANKGYWIKCKNSGTIKLKKN